MAAQGSNPLELPLKELFNRLNELNGLFYHLEQTIEQTRKSLEGRIPSPPGDMPIIGISSNFVILDLTEIYANNTLWYHPIGWYGSEDNQYLEVMAGFLSRSALWTISQAYEFFETCVLDLTASLLHAHPNLVTAKEQVHFTKSRKSSLPSSDIDYWKKFVRYEFDQGKIETLLKFLRTITPDIEKTENGSNHRQINLIDWFKIITIVRHAITHSGFLVKDSETQKLSPTQQSLLTNYVSGGFIGKNFSLKGSTVNAQDNLRLFAEYAFTIFKFLSQSQGYIVDIKDWASS